MESILCWVCKSCGASVDVRLRECPKCKQPQPIERPAPIPYVAGTGDAKPQIASWKQAISIPAALLGIVAFFMPWVQVSCGPVRFSFSGYEFATGEADHKLSRESFDEFHQRMQESLKKESGQPGSLRSPTRKQTSTPIQAKSNESHRIPVLWGIPAACAILVVLALLGFPRLPTVLVSLLASAYLAYLGVSWESQLSDPAMTGGILDHSWLPGYWVSWLGLLTPMVMALAPSPRRR